MHIEEKIQELKKRHSLYDGAVNVLVEELRVIDGAIARMEAVLKKNLDVAYISQAGPLLENLKHRDLARVKSKVLRAQYARVSFR